MIRYIALITTMLLLTVACSGGSGTDTAQVAPPNPTATVISPTPASTSGGSDTDTAQVSMSEPTATIAPSVPTPTKVTPKPTPTPKPEYLLDFEDIENNVAEVSRIAWEDSHRILALNSKTSNANTKLIISVGPTTQPYFDNSEEAYRKAITFWSGFDQPTIYWALIYNYEDKYWAKEEIEKASFLKYPDPTIVDLPCHGSICSGANSGVEPDTSVGLGVLGIHQPDSWDPYRFGAIQIHEYGHAVQAAPWIGDDDPNAGHQRAAPCWSGEGTPHFAGLSVGTNSYEDYQKIRAQQVWGDLFSQHPRVPSFDDFSPIKIVEYYDTGMPCTYPPDDNYDLGYSLGFLTVEALSAIGGSDSSMDLYKLMKNNTFSEAFELTYGSPWDEAKHILASVVSANVLDIESNIAKFQ